MNNLARKNFFYRQLYKFYYSTNDLAHQSRKSDPLPKNAFVQADFDSSSIPKDMLFLASLPQTSFFKFLKYVILSLCGLDKNTLMDAKKIRSLSAYFFPQGNFLSIFNTEKKFFSQKINLNMPIPERITDDWIYSSAYALLNSLFANQSHELHQRFLLRFPKEVETQNQDGFPKIEDKLALDILKFVISRHFPSFVPCLDK